jgi:hypothetical protein
MWTHHEVTAVKTSDSKTAGAGEQLCGHFSQAIREHRIMEKTFSVRFVPGWLRVAVVRREKLVAEAGESSGKPECCVLVGRYQHFGITTASLKMEVADPCDMLETIYQNKRRYIPEDSNLHRLHCKNLALYK